MDTCEVEWKAGFGPIIPKPLDKRGRLEIARVTQIRGDMSPIKLQKRIAFFDVE